MNKFERLLAWRYLRPKHQDGFTSIITLFSFLGITLGVGTLIVVMAVMQGFHDELMAKILGFNGHVSVYARNGPLPQTDPVITNLSQQPHVKAIAPFIERQALVTNRNGAFGVRVHGISAVDLQSRPQLAPSFKLLAGDLTYFTGASVILGKRLAEKLRLQIGQQVTLMNPQGQATAFGLMPKSQKYTVVGVFDIGMAEYNQSYIFIPLAHAQTFFNLPNQVSGLEVFLDHSEAVHTLPELGDAYRLLNWQEANQSLFNAVRVERNMMFIILTLLIVIAAFNIISGLTMLVKDKQSNIAILRTMGMTRASIMRVFCLAGSTIGLSGTLAGFSWGLAFALNIEHIRRGLERFLGNDLFNEEIYFLTQLPAVVRLTDVIAVCGVAIILSFLATIYPAWRAAKLDPVAGLRHG